MKINSFAIEYCVSMSCISFVTFFTSKIARYVITLYISFSDGKYCVTTQVKIIVIIDDDYKDSIVGIIRYKQLDSLDLIKTKESFIYMKKRTVVPIF